MVRPVSALWSQWFTAVVVFPLAAFISCVLTVCRAPRGQFLCLPVCTQKSQEAQRLEDQEEQTERPMTAAAGIFSLRHVCQGDRPPDKRKQSAANPAL